MAAQKDPLARQFVVSKAVAGITLVEGLCRCLYELSPRAAGIAVELGCVFVDRRRVEDPARVLSLGQHVSVHLGRPFREAMLAGAVPVRRHELRVLHRDEDVVVVSKPAGLLTAPTSEGNRETLKTLLTAEFGELFVVHRLDLHTSGVLILARTPHANRVLGDTFRRHCLVRRYDAFVAHGYPVERETLNAPVDGRPATSHVEVHARQQRTTHLRITLETGRTHQIRKHLAGRGYPILGDHCYGTRTDFDPPRIALHARILELAHPVTQAPLAFELELPSDLLGWLG